MSDIDGAGNVAADGEKKRNRDHEEDTLAWLDLAYHKVFAPCLSTAKSQNLNRAQARDSSANPRHSNKANFKMGTGELPHVPPWAHPYAFTPLTTYEFVSRWARIYTVGITESWGRMRHKCIPLALDTEWRGYR